MRLAASVVAVILAGCNGIAGIADLHTGDLDAASEGGGSTSDAQASADAGTDARPPPSCPGSEVGLRISVTTSSSTFTRVDGNNGISVNVGETKDYCFPSQTQLSLQAFPDDSNATHDWTGAGCATPARRCVITLMQTTTIDVRL